MPVLQEKVEYKITPVEGAGITKISPVDNKPVIAWGAGEYLQDIAKQHGLNAVANPNTVGFYDITATGPRSKAFEKQVGTDYSIQATPLTQGERYVMTQDGGMRLEGANLDNHPLYGNLMSAEPTVQASAQNYAPIKEAEYKGFFGSVKRIMDSLFGGNLQQDFAELRR